MLQCWQTRPAEGEFCSLMFDMVYMCVCVHAYTGLLWVFNSICGLALVKVNLKQQGYTALSEGFISYKPCSQSPLRCILNIDKSNRCAR